MANYVEQSIEFIPQEEGYEGAIKLAERAARTCYHSEHLIKEGSANKIVFDTCAKNGHTSVLEFATIYLKVNICRFNTILKYLKDRYSRVRIVGYNAYITTTLRTIMQGNYSNPIEAITYGFDKDWKDDLKYWCEPTKYHHKRYCYKIVCDRAGSQSFMRHRGTYGISYAQESTRYCNYTNKKRFGDDINISIPYFFENSILDKCVVDELKECYNECVNYLYGKYTHMVELGLKPEEARGILPLDVNTTFLMCAYKEDWEMWLFRRLDSHAHPKVQQIASQIFEDLKSKDITNNSLFHKVLIKSLREPKEKK